MRRYGAFYEDVHKLGFTGYSHGKRRCKRNSGTRVKPFGVCQIYPGTMQGSFPETHYIQMRDEFQFISPAELNPKTLHLLS